VQRPIPIWLGGQSPVAYRRMGRLADGWFPQVPPGERLEEAKAIVAESATASGRDPASLGMEGRVSISPGGAERFADHVGRWQEAGATHLTVNTMGFGYGSEVSAHLDALELATQVLGH
jgi:alkanesulfonate monooxygenase SsuD/methylene tetrahydromethanopterin reductase-like flavin-dependent oxidoreductase (luciferase family)